MLTFFQSLINLVEKLKKLHVHNKLRYFHKCTQKAEEGGSSLVLTLAVLRERLNLSNNEFSLKGRTFYCEQLQLLRCTVGLIGRVAQTRKVLCLFSFILLLKTLRYEDVYSIHLIWHSLFSFSNVCTKMRALLSSHEFFFARNTLSVNKNKNKKPLACKMLALKML